jgi:hypothetical protein
MAKKNTLPSGLISASAALAESQAPRDYTADFMKSFNAITNEFEEKRKSEQNEIAEWLGGLTTDIDFTRMSLQMETATKDQLVAYKNEISDLANIIAKSKNKGSIEVKNATDRINEIYREAAIMEAEISAYNQDKVSTALGIENKIYSIDEDLQLYRDIYGYKDGGAANASFNGGHLEFNVSNENIKYADILSPTVKDEIHKGIIGQAKLYEDNRQYELTDNEILMHRSELKDAFSNNKAFGAFLLDTPKEFQLKDITAEYITAKNNGTLADVIDDLKARAINMIVQGFQDAASVGVSRYKADKKAQTPQRTISDRERAFTAMSPIIGSTDGRSWILVDSDGKSLNQQEVDGDGVLINEFKGVKYKRGKWDTSLRTWSFEDDAEIKVGDLVSWRANS